MGGKRKHMEDNKIYKAQSALWIIIIIVKTFDLMLSINILIK